MPERRSTKRRPKRLRLRYGPEKPERYALTEDISTDGLFIKTSSALFPGRTVTIEITHRDGSTTLLVARVMWIKRVPASLAHMARKAGMGVKIIRFIEGEELYRQLCSGNKTVVLTDHESEQ